VFYTGINVATARLIKAHTSVFYGQVRTETTIVYGEHTYILVYWQNEDGHTDWINIDGGRGGFAQVNRIRTNVATSESVDEPSRREISTIARMAAAWLCGGFDMSLSECLAEMIGDDGI
jgi:hypothetical protein